MRREQVSRRKFLTDSSHAATAGWLALQLPWVAALASCARQDAAIGEGFTHLTIAEAGTMRAFAAQILPSGDGVPGAEEAGAVYFVDRALGMPLFAEKEPLIRRGLADLDARARALSGTSNFTSLSSERQIAVMKSAEREAYFAAARMLVVMGTLTEPSYGGNRNGAGWELIGVDHHGDYAAPYGWYDAQAAKNASNPAS